MPVGKQHPEVSCTSASDLALPLLNITAPFSTGISSYLNPANSSSHIRTNSLSSFRNASSRMMTASLLSILNTNGNAGYRDICCPSDGGPSTISRSMGPDLGIFSMSYHNDG